MGVGGCVGGGGGFVGWVKKNPNQEKKYKKKKHSDADFGLKTILLVLFGGEGQILSKIVTGEEKRGGKGSVSR